MKKMKFPLKEKYIAMLAPSFVVDFSYPKIIYQLRDLGFDKVVELTFGAKMVNKNYQEYLKNTNKLAISSVCPGIVETINSINKKYSKNLIPVDSPMIATAKICKKIYPSHRLIFISPCNFKKLEAKKSKLINEVIDYKKLNYILIEQNLQNKKYSKKKTYFDKFYNDYTKIYPLSGGLSKTANFKGIVKKEEVKIIDGMNKVNKFLSSSNSKIKFLDVTFCKGGCIGGPCINSKLPIFLRKRILTKYLNIAAKEKIPKGNKGIIEKASKINFKKANK